jgi:hypothetical protein
MPIPIGSGPGTSSRASAPTRRPTKNRMIKYATRPIPATYPLEAAPIAKRAASPGIAAPATMRSTLNRRHPTGSVPRYSELGLTGAAGIRRRSTCRCSSNWCKGSPTTSTLSPRSSRSAPSTSSNIDGRWRAGQGLQGIQVNVPREAVAVTEATCPVQRPAAPASRPHLHRFSPSRAGRSRGASRFPRRHRPA